MNILLTSQERKDLIGQHRSERDRRVCDRIKAILAYDEGYSYEEIARLFLLDDQTIRRHVKDFCSRRKLKTENGGSSSFLTEEQKQELVAHLKEKTYRYTRDIIQYVFRTHGVSYSLSGMTKWLKQQDFAYKKPHGVPAKAEPARQAEFIERYQALKAELGKDEVIYFKDSVHPHHQTRLAYGWIKRGERKGIAMTGRQYHLNVIGAINLETHEVVHTEVSKVNEENLINFLKQLRSHHAESGFIHLILDNAGYNHSKKVKAYADEVKIRLHYLPPYSPNLNPIERLWKVMHEEVTYNRYYEKFCDFADAIRNFFNQISTYKDILKNRITDRFQLISKPNFAS